MAANLQLLARAFVRAAMLQANGGANKPVLEKIVLGKYKPADKELHFSLRNGILPSCSMSAAKSPA